MAFASCTNFNGRVCLSKDSSPYSTVCSGNSFINRGLEAYQVSPEAFQCIDEIWNEFDELWNNSEYIWNASPCIIRDFMEERTPGLFDSNMCMVHPLADIEWQVRECTNRFGGAILEEVGNTSNIRETYDESCVGYKTSNSGNPLDHKWSTFSLGFFRGSAQIGKPTLQGGPCVGTEPDYEYTIYSDPINCSGIGPCFELLRQTCVFDGSVAFPDDPACDTGIVFPDSLFQENFYCNFNPAAANQRRNSFCSTNDNNIRLQVPSVKFCEREKNFPYLLENVAFCATNPDDLRLIIQNAHFCSYDSSFIRPTIIVQNVAFCSQDRDTLLPVVPSVNFCSQGPIINNVGFCNYPRTLIDNVGEAEFCNFDDNGIRLQINNVQFCSQFVAPSVRFCNTDRGTIDGVNEAEFCSQKRNGNIDGTTSVRYCEFDATAIQSSTRYCSQDRTTLDGATSVKFCSMPRLATFASVDYCSQDRENIDGAGIANYCSQDRKGLDNVVDVTFCNYEVSNIRLNVVSVNYCSHERKNIDGAGEATFCSQERKGLDNVDEAQFCSQDKLSI